MWDIIWVPRGRDFLSSMGGRFDLMLTPRGDWLAIDAEAGCTFRGERAGCELWCETQATKVRA